MHKYKTQNATMWCSKCGATENIRILTSIHSTNGFDTIKENSISIFSGLRADCGKCGAEMLSVDSKFVNVCEKLRYLGVKILDINAAYTTPHNSTTDKTSSDTFCSGASITIVLEHSQDSLHSEAFSNVCGFNEECAELGTININEDYDLGGICINSVFDIVEGKFNFGFVNKDAVGGDKKLKKYCEISDDRLLRFLDDFIKNIEGD